MHETSVKGSGRGDTRLFVQEAVEAFLEEVVVRRELSDNYCHYEPNYDNIRGAAQWAQDSLEKHRSDEREYLYTL